MEVDETLIETLEDMLVEAKAGRIQRMLCLYDDGQQIDFHVVKPVDGPESKAMLAALAGAIIEDHPELANQ